MNVWVIMEPGEQTTISEWQTPGVSELRAVTTASPRQQTRGESRIEAFTIVVRESSMYRHGMGHGVFWTTVAHYEHISHGFPHSTFDLVLSV